jgi:catalase-peroxidase|tara:strand:- start:251 stop:478 length:228 start_codon:yes stop_codon:yes gene_type:complete
LRCRRFRNGVFTDRPGVLRNDSFIKLLDMATVWTPASDGDVFEGRDRMIDEAKWNGTRVDLASGLNSERRALAEV